MVAMIGLGCVVGLVPPWVGPSCGMAPWVQFAAMAFKIALGCVIGALAGLLENVKRGALTGILIGGFAGACFGSPIGITFNSPFARFGIGAAVGGLIGALGGLAGKTTPLQDRTGGRGSGK